MIVVTGGAGFIGSNVVHELNHRGRSDVIVVDDLTDSTKVSNVADADIADYLDRDHFRRLFTERSPLLDSVELVIHQGASSSTTEADGRFVMDVNYEYSKSLATWSVERGIPLVYASSAAVYGAGNEFTERPENERPLNVYGWSKLLMDNFVRRLPATRSSRIVGLRYFNVFGPREDHKGDMASIVTQLDNAVRTTGTATIFGASHGYAPGHQSRDFVSVHDVVDVILWCADHPTISGVFNCGTGTATTFESVARSVLAHHDSGRLEFREFPTELVDRYQPMTRADLSQLRAAGYTRAFTPTTDAIEAYLAARSDRR